MEPSQAFLSPSTPVAPPANTIRPSQVWRNLSQDQQERLLQAIVLICQELIYPPSPVRESEVANE
jgi:hypothetical protein